MIRPHAKSFMYDEKDIEGMKRSIAEFKKEGCDGFVFGCLEQIDTGEMRVDKETCTILLERTAGKKVTFHRAFDSISPSDMEEELELLIELGFDAVLTSGGAKSAVEGREVLKMLVEKAGGRIEIIVGGGVRSGCLEELRRDIVNGDGGRGGGVRWWHSSAVTDSGSREDADADEVEALGRIIGMWDEESGGNGK